MGCWAQHRDYAFDSAHRRFNLHYNLSHFSTSSSHNLMPVGIEIAYTETDEQDWTRNPFFVCSATKLIAFIKVLIFPAEFHQEEKEAWISERIIRVAGFLTQLALGGVSFASFPYLRFSERSGKRNTHTLSLSLSYDIASAVNDCIC